MLTQRLLLFLISVVLISAGFAVAAAESLPSTKVADHNRKGLQYYEEAYYRNLPNGKQREADESFNLAIAEFKAAITADPGSAAAHRNLARVYFIREDYLQAADAYRTVTILEPQDIDTYALLALCYAQANRFADAVRALETAKTRTNNPEILGNLDAYIKKINNREQK